MLHWFASSKKVVVVSCVDSLHIPYIVKFLYKNISLGDEKYSQNVWSEKHTIWQLRPELRSVQ